MEAALAAVPVPEIPPSTRKTSGMRPAQRGPENDPPPTLRDGGSPPATDQPRVEIELLIHSDRPNPRWLLDELNTETLLAQLPDDSSLMPTALEGYGGFNIRIDSEGHHRIVEVFHNTALERWLLNSGRFYLPSEVARLVEEHLI
jgi:hypothetical protein